MEKRKLHNILSIIIFSASLIFCIIGAVEIGINVKRNNELTQEKEKIENAFAEPSDDYYDVYVVDDYTVYDEKVIIEFPR